MSGVVGVTWLVAARLAAADVIIHDTYVAFHFPRAILWGAIVVVLIAGAIFWLFAGDERQSRRDARALGVGARRTLQ